LVVLAIAGCTASGTTHGLAVPDRAQVVLAKAEVAVPLAGTRLSALLVTPAGFTLDVRTSYNSGASVLTAPTPPGANPRRLSCASWWAGTNYGPGELGYAVKNFTSSGGTTLTVIVNLFPRGAGAGVFDASVALHNRCTHFTYRDASDHLWYQVAIKPGSSAGLGDRSQTYDATETASGQVFPTEITVIQVGDATIGFNQTGPAGSPPVRVVPPLGRLIAALRAAGY
jgi:hypothetical protein